MSQVVTPIEVPITVEHQHCPEATIAEVLKTMKSKDIQIDSMTRDGHDWTAVGSISKFGGRVQMNFSFKMGKA